MKEFINPPTFENASQTRAAYFLHVISLSMILAGLSVCLIEAARYDWDQIPPAVPPVLTGVVFSGLIMLLNHRGVVQLAGTLFLLMLLGVITYLLQVGQGVHDIAITLYPLVIIIGSLIQNRRQLFWIYLATCLSLAYVVFGEINHWFKPQLAEIEASAGDFFTVLIILTVTLLAMRLLADSMMKNYWQARRQAEQLDTLNKIGMAILSLQGVQAVLKIGLEEIQKTVPLDVFYVALMSEDDTQITFPIMYDDGEYWQEPAREMLPESFIRKVYESQEPLLLDFSSDEIYPPVQYKLGDKSRSVVTALLVPLYTGQRVIGVLSVQSYTAKVYSAEHITFLTVAANQLAIAIQNSRLYEASQNFNEALEKRVQKRTAELEQANQELEAFSYSVSHDLRAPLRSISGFSGILQDRFGGELPEEAGAYLDRIQQGALQMSGLIDDLLSFSRLTRQDLQTQEINLNTVVAGLIDDLTEHLVGQDIVWEITALPNARADLAMTRQVFLNLLENAIKYSRTKAVSKIAVGSFSDGVEQVYFVKDNGVGFDMAYQHKIFGVFQRLHVTDEFEGTGVGLAIVQHIIIRHGGKIWAEAVPNEGAAFYFTFGES